MKKIVNGTQFREKFKADKSLLTSRHTAQNKKIQLIPILSMLAELFSGSSRSW